MGAYDLIQNLRNRGLAFGNFLFLKALEELIERAFHLSRE
jgi:hypothetical protein